MKSKNNPSFSSHKSGRFMFFLQIMLLLLVLTPAGVLALEITSVNPSGTVLQSDIVLEAVTDVASTCNYNLNGNSGSMNGNNTLHVLTTNLADGEYTAYFSCADTTESDTAETTFTVDAVPPEIILSDFPEEINNQPYQVEIETNEPATCKYSETETSYANMENFFEKISSKKHYMIIEGKTQGFYTYHLACRDKSDKTSYEDREFFINERPAARITIDKNDPLKAGLYEVKLLVSEQLGGTPTLSYSFEGKNRAISLKKDGDVWEGYLLIEEDDGTKIATFNFQGKDASGLQGTEITQGKIFLIDTEAPELIEVISAEPDEDEITLEWEYEDEVKEFIIYRDTKPDVDIIDEYKTVTEKEYVDDDVDEGEKYYYRVAAVDDAGNIGELSEELEVLALEVKDETDGLEPALLFKLEKTIEDFESEQYDFESALRSITKSSDDGVAKIDNEFKVSDKLEEAVNSIKDLIEEMEKIKDEEFSESEYNKRINKYEEQLNQIKEETYVGIRIIDQKTVTISADEAAISTAINEYLLGTEISDEDRENYTLTMKELQTNINVVGNIIVAELQSLDEDKKVTLVVKDISADEVVNKASIIEVIPKEFSRRASDMKFSNNPIILKEDPVVQWDLTTLSTQKFTYSLEEQKNANLLSLTSTVILTRPTITKTEVPQITGNVTGEDEGAGMGFWQIFLLIFFVLTVGGLTGYYFLYVKPETPVVGEFEEKKLNNLISYGHQAADDMQTDKAKNLYMDSYKLYLALEDSKKETVYPSLNHLHSKILLMGIIDSARTALDNNQKGVFLQLLNQIKNTERVVVEGTVFGNYLGSTLRYFEQRAA